MNGHSPSSYSVFMVGIYQPPNPYLPKIGNWQIQPAIPHIFDVIINHLFRICRQILFSFSTAASVCP